MVLTLEEAQEYALSHNKTLQGARLDVRAAEMARWDVVANGLPRVDGSGSLNDNLKLMTNLLPAEIFGGEPGTYIPVQFGTKYNTSYGIQATQLIFSAPYFVGLSMAKLTEKISNQALEKSELDIRESVISTYYLILVSEESLVQVEKNIENLRDILKSTEAMYSVGMAEATDVDQIKSNITMIENSKRSVERNIEFSYNLDRTGWQKGNIEIRDYPVSFDNIFHFAYYISDEIPVLQIYSGRENVNMQALFESDSYFDYHHAESGSIPYQDLKIFKLIILNSLSEFSPNLTQLLSDYVDQGGSLIITPPDEGKMTGINTFTQKFKAPVFSNLLVRESEARIPENMKSFYADISMNPDQQVEWPSYSKYYRLVDNFSKSETILTNETGRPLLTRNSFGNGFIALSAAPLTEDFTNFQVHPLFIPFLYYLANS